MSASTPPAKTAARSPRRIDPTANVLKLVKQETKRQDDLRRAATQMARKLAKQESRWRDKLAKAESKRLDAERKQESERVNSLLAANTSNVALALAKQEAQTLTQDRRLAIVEQNQYSGAGREVQRVETRGQSNFNLSQWITVGGILVLVALDLHSKGVI